MKTDKDVAVIDVPAKDIMVMPNQYDRLIESGFNSNADLERMERLFELKKLHEENEARKEYFKAMAEFKKDPPLIKKDTPVKYQNSDGSWTVYNHADLGKSLNLISKGLSPHGLSINFKQEQGNGGLTITCFLTHRLGYSESTSLFAAPDSSGGKNGIQGIGSTDSYLRRYTMFSITGLAAEGEDDDGRMSESKVVEYIDEEQISQLADMLLAIDKTEAEYCKHRNVESLKDIPLSTFNICVSELKPMDG